MSDSATGVRERRMEATANRLSSLVRRLTAEHGLAGFTIEELCERADVSRRTFFNYFASKEDALFGRSLRNDDAELDQAFVDGGDTASAELSPTLLEDFADLMVKRWSRLGLDRESVEHMIAAFEREPHLFRRALEMSSRSEEEDAALVERREGLEAGDLRAAAVVQIVGALGRATAQQFLDPANTDPIESIVARRLDAARAILRSP